MDDQEFQTSAYSILSKEIFDSIRAKEADTSQP
jgi:hypothetical protein